MSDKTWSLKKSQKMMEHDAAFIDKCVADLASDPYVGTEVDMNTCVAHFGDD